MKKNICLLVLCIASLCVVAQETKELKQVKLKSGISISGYVTNNTDGSISITTVDGDELWYRSDEIQSVSEDPAIVEARRKAEAKAKEEEELRIAKEKEDAKAAKRAEKEAIIMKDKGFQFMAELDFGFASNIWSSFDGEPEPGIKIVLVPGYRFNEHLFAGIGIGYRSLGWKIFDDAKHYYLDRYHLCQYTNSYGYGPTIFTRVTYNFKEKRVTPYFAMNAGYCLLSSLDLKGEEYYYSNKINYLSGVEYHGWTRYAGGSTIETANSIGAYYIEGNFGYMFRTRKGSGLNIGLSLTYSPAPSSVHGVNMDNLVMLGASAGWTF